MPITWLDEEESAPSLPQQKNKITWLDEEPQEDRYSTSSLADLITGNTKKQTPAEIGALNTANEMSTGERLLAGYGRGVEEVGQAAKQLGMRADALLTPESDDSTFTRLLKSGTARMLGTQGNTPQSAIDQYDNQVRDDANTYNSGLGQTTAGNVGRFVGGAATTAPLPLGGLAGAAGRGVVASALGSAVAGAVGSVLTTPVTSDSNFLEEKAKQAVLGGAVGAGSNLALRGVGRLLEDIGYGNALPRTLNALTKKANKAEFADEGEQLAQKYGVELTPGQISGSKAQNAVENIARQSIYTRDKVFQNDMKIADQYVNAIDRAMGKISKTDTDAITAGTTIRDTVTKASRALQTQRSRAAAADFAEVDKLANGAPTIIPQNYKSALEDLYKENSIAPKGSDSRALADTLGELHKGVIENAVASNLLKTRRYLSQVASGQAGLAGSAGQPMQKRAAKMLLDAIDQDIDVSAQQAGGDIGAALKTANQRYREYSQKIDGIKKGPLGKLIGDDLVDTAGDGFSSVPPETLFTRFSKLTPSQMQVATKLLKETDDESFQAVKRAYVKQALDNAQSQLPTGGAQQASVRPSQFINSLARTPQDRARLTSLFNTQEKSELEDLFKIGRRMGDRTGYNTSETAIANETLGLLGSLKSGLVNAGMNVAAKALGTNQIARMMTDSGGRKALLQLRKLPPSSQKARELTAYLSSLIAVDTEPVEEEE